MPKPLWAALVALLATCDTLHAAKLPKYNLTPETQAALDRVSPVSLRGHLSFLASDLLEGRGTPSRGLEIAAEYIAAQFRRAGLEPAVNGEYFQVADMVVKRPVLDGFRLELTAGDHEIKVAPEDVILETTSAIDATSTPVLKLTSGDSHKAEDLDGKVVVVGLGQTRGLRKLLSNAHPLLVIIVGRTSPGAMPRESLIDPTQTAHGVRSRILIFSPKAADFVENMPAGEKGKAAIHIAPPREENAKLRNVIGVLPGSDPALKDTYVLVSAHYDHLGVKPQGSGDRIYNGADDDASGTASVIEIANSLAGLKKRPARSIAFITFFGEEEGLIGSEYYVHHPVIPLSQIVADVNLEQLGRTDSTRGPEIATAGPTGYGYSTMIDEFRAAGEQTRVKVYDPESDSDRFFAQSDNYSFAEIGIPAHTFCVAFEFPDYHAVGDEWQKIDYDNMAKVDRMLALGIIMLGDDPAAPRWNPDNPKAKRYADALKR